MFTRYLDRVIDFINDPYFPTPTYKALWFALFNAKDYQ